MTRVISRPLKVLDAATGLTTGGVFGCGGMTEFSITVEGITAGEEVDVLASNDGVNFYAAVTTITADGAYDIPGGYKYLRADVVTAGASNPIDAWIAGN